jgi:NAD(P) transhydrogenase subunit alpha
MKIGVPKETAENERRVALTPEAAGKLVKAGFTILVERGAGESAAFMDEAYKAAGATIVPKAADVLGQSDVILKLQLPGTADIKRCREGAALIALFQPAAEREAIPRLAARKLTVFSLALLPRITRAQAMDVLSSQATVAGYKAVLLAAATAGRLFPMLVTAAGTLPPARVLVLGAGVAGLQAIATARRLGAVVSAFDVRAAVKEQVESLGAKFVAMDLGEKAEAAGGYAKQLSQDAHERELQFLAQQVKDADIVISTAAIPGKKAPVLITKAAVRGMKPGSVIVDLAAETGGNCELTEAGEDVVEAGVTILGPLNLASTLPYHASQMYARNISTFLQYAVKDGALKLDFDDEIIRDTCVTHAGEVRKA